MKTLKENMKGVAVYAAADTTNAEGFAAWTPSDAALLEQLAMTGTLGNAFYATAREATADAVKLLERADAQALAAAIVLGDSSVLTYATVSAMFVGFFVKGLENVTVLPWDTEVQPYTVPRVDSVMTHIDAITRMVGGGTYMETAVNYMHEKGIDADFAVFLTDTEEYGSGWLAAWRKYHRRNPQSVAFVLRGDSYMTSPIPEAEAEKLNVYQVFGWNDSVVDYMKFVLEKLKAA